jgi:hypothetical protein
MTTSGFFVCSRLVTLVEPGFRSELSPLVFLCGADDFVPGGTTLSRLDPGGLENMACVVKWTTGRGQQPLHCLDLGGFGQRKGSSPLRAPLKMKGAFVGRRLRPAPPPHRTISIWIFGWISSPWESRLPLGSAAGGGPRDARTEAKMPGRHQFSRANGSSASSTAPFIMIRAPSPETRTGRTGVLSQTHASRTSSLAPAVGALPGSSTGPLRDRVNARAATA